MGAACAVGRPATGSAEAADFTGRGYKAQRENKGSTGPSPLRQLTTEYRHAVGISAQWCTECAGIRPMTLDNIAGQD